MLITRRHGPMLKRRNEQQARRRELSDAKAKAAVEARSDERRRIERELTIYHRVEANTWSRPILLNTEPAQPYHRIAIGNHPPVDLFSEEARRYVLSTCEVVTFRAVRKNWACDGAVVCWWDWELVR